MLDQRHIAELTVTSCILSSSKTSKPPSATETTIDVKAQGVWLPHAADFPISVHFTTFLGNKLVPPVGGTLKVTIEAA